MTQSRVERRYSKLAAAVNRKARLLGYPGRITASQMAVVYLRAGGRCEYCGVGISPDGVSFDHKVALARGGTNDAANLAAVCITCQRTKFTKTPQQHAEWMDTVLTCKGCGKQFRPRYADWARGFGIYCSRSCSGRAGGETPSIRAVAGV